MENIYKERLFTYVLLLSLLVVIFLMTFLGLIWGAITNELFFDKINFIAISSFFVFVGICVISLASTNLYFVFLIFQIIAFPATIDNLIPGTYFGDQTELNASITPLFTHIDLFILLGIIKGVIKRNKLILVNSRLLTLSVLILFASSFVNIFYSRNTQDFLLIISGFMHLRYLIGIYLLFSIYDPGNYSKQILNGFVISVIFLFIEALIFTKINGVDRLTSGTLGNNSFGNIIACITIYFIFVSKLKISYSYQVILSITIAIGIITVVLSQTRMALISGFVLFIIGTFYHSRKSFVAVLYLMLIFFVIVSSVMFSSVYETDLAKRFDIVRVVSKIHLSLPWSDNNMIEIEPSVETASLLTRLKLYDTSTNMIVDNPIFGIGSMRWDYYKGEYGFEEEILLDTHNGYLAVISQFGIFAITFIYLIYLWPIKILKNKSILRDSNVYLALITLGMAICDLSNAGIYKHQIFALLSLNVIVLIHTANRKTTYKYE